MKEKRRNSVAVLLDYAGGHRRLTIAGRILPGISAVLTTVPYICIWYVIREVIRVVSDYENAGGAVYYEWMALWFALANATVYFAALMCTHLAAFQTTKNMRKAVAFHLVDVPLGYFTASQSGCLRKQIDDNAGMTETVLAHGLPNLVGAVVTPVAATIPLSVFDWRMGPTCLLSSAVSVYLLTRMMGGKNADFFERYQKFTEEPSAEATEYVRGVPVVKVFQQTVYSFKSFYTSIIKYKELVTDRVMGCGRPMTAFTMVLNSTFLLLIPIGMLLCARASDGWAVLVDLLFYTLFTPLCTMMMNRTLLASTAIMEVDEAVRRLVPIVGTEPLKKPAGGDGSVPSEISIEFRDVSFIYPGVVSQTLSHVSFQVMAGRAAAFVGPSGGGKTTAVSLIPRFWDVDAGQVFIDGVNVRNIPSRELMNLISFVFQDTHLSKISLLENIRVTRPDVTEKEALGAAHAAQCDGILAKMPQGIHAVVGTKGIYLSGGEQQRITLVWAILKDVPIVVLDEAAAFADPENEMLIQEAFETLARGRTVLMTAHRLPTVQGTDRTLMLESGVVAESGTHRGLLERKGVYTAMWKDYQTSAQWKVGKEVLA